MASKLLSYTRSPLPSRAAPRKSSSGKLSANRYHPSLSSAGSSISSCSHLLSCVDPSRGKGGPSHRHLGPDLSRDHPLPPSSRRSHTPGTPMSKCRALFFSHWCRPPGTPAHRSTYPLSSRRRPPLLCPAAPTYCCAADLSTYHKTMSFLLVVMARIAFMLIVVIPLSLYRHQSRSSLFSVDYVLLAVAHALQ